MRSVPTTVACLVVMGCDDTLFTAGGTDSDAVPADYTPDMDGLVALFDDHCMDCHGPSSGGSVILPDVIQADLDNGTTFYVTPGSPDDSKLWRVLGGELADGDFAAMPLGDPLPPSHVQHVYDCIAGW